MPDQEEYEQQLQILKAYRRTLAHLLEQAANHGGITYAPPAVANGIREARQEVTTIKRVIRGWGYSVDDNPMDGDARTSVQPASPTEPPLPVQATPSVQALSSKQAALGIDAPESVQVTTTSSEKPATQILPSRTTNKTSDMKNQNEQVRVKEPASLAMRRTKFFLIAISMTFPLIILLNILPKYIINGGIFGIIAAFVYFIVLVIAALWLKV